ncbi:efflux RND transporter periplasmic adaptor subunit [Yoonia sp.]|uniref:efflux RND transporter periplasmic adaptor subunit n=1 Tax=Yoonia sp. TaxID=2212373 RepID=UPI003A4D3849
MARMLAGGALALSAMLAANAGHAQGFGINCTIKPTRVVELSSAAMGIVAEVYVVPGQRVGQGDVLARIDDRALQGELALAEARAGITSGLAAAETRAAALRQRLARLTEALNRRAISAAEHEAAATELALAEADILRERDQLLMAGLERDRVLAQMAAMEITSPVTGIIGENLVNPGEAAAPNPVATIHVTSPLRVEAYVPAARLAQVVEAESHIIIIGDDPTPVPVIFDYAAPMADLASNTISVFFKLDSDSILPGSRCFMPNSQS